MIFNDDTLHANTSKIQRRDMFVSELVFEDGIYTAKRPQKIIHPVHYKNQLWQKNWVPFEKEGALLFSYTIDPHEVLYADLENGVAPQIAITKMAHNPWKWGNLRGGTPAVEMDDHYIGFFHSWIQVNRFYHYYMGAYTFAKEAPFEVKKISSKPIAAFDFYRNHRNGKKVIFPGGLVEREEDFLVVYGVDDNSIFYAYIPKKDVYETLLDIETLE